MVNDLKLDTIAKQIRIKKEEESQKVDDYLAGPFTQLISCPTGSTSLYPLALILLNPVGNPVVLIQTFDVNISHTKVWDKALRYQDKCISAYCFFTSILPQCYQLTLFPPQIEGSVLAKFLGIHYYFVDSERNLVNIKSLNDFSRLSNHLRHYLGNEAVDYLIERLSYFPVKDSKLDAPYYLEHYVTRNN